MGAVAVWPVKTDGEEEACVPIDEDVDLPYAAVADWDQQHHTDSVLQLRLRIVESASWGSFRDVVPCAVDVDDTDGVCVDASVVVATSSFRRRVQVAAAWVAAEVVVVAAVGVVVVA